MGSGIDEGFGVRGQVVADNARIVRESGRVYESAEE